jgi:hypothetical protein
MENALFYTKGIIEKLYDYENLSDKDFEKYVDAIVRIHFLKFGINSFYSDYINNFKNSKNSRKVIFNKMFEFVPFLIEKGEEQKQ